MNDTAKTSSEFILRRLNEAFPYSSTSTSQTEWLIVIGVLFAIGIGAFAFTLFRRGTDKWFNPITRLMFGPTHEANFVSALIAGILRGLLFIFPAICLCFARSASGSILWWVLVIGMTVLATLLTLSGYLRDSQTSKYWTFLLVPLRVAVYVVLAAAFMLPAIQNWEDSEKRSRVLVIIDVSPSIASWSDEVASSGRKPQTRLEKMLDVLTDKNVDLIAKLVEKNPVFVYRFGSRLDDDATPFTKSDATADASPVAKATAAKAANADWTKEDWKAWAIYDFKRYALQGLSENGRKILQSSAAWKANEPGNADWALTWSKLPEAEAIPAELSASDSDLVKSNRSRLEKRADTARSLVLGTNVADSLTAAINRESSNMVQGLIVFTDGRSNMGSDGSYSALADAATKNKIPIFTIAVGEPRENISIAITDVQAPDRVAPDEPFKVMVGVDGVGLAGQLVKVKLKMYLPGNDPKKGKPDFVMPDDLKVQPTAEKPKNSGEMTFLPGDPPNGQVEFEIDPDSLPAELLEEKQDKGPEPKKGETPKPKGTGKLQLKTGPWNFVASIARHPKEVFQDPEHLSVPRPVQVFDKKLRILMVASGPTREYQTMRSLLAREVDQQRAELSIYMQNEGGVAGTIVQDVPAERLLTRFPDRLDTTGKSDTPENMYYNLNSYDLLLLFDPDWQETGADSTMRISEPALKNIQTWVDNLGGGIIYIAGPIHTFQLARGEPRLQPIVDVLPVLPEDIVVVKGRGIPREPRRLRLKPSPDFDVLKLRDDRASVDDPIAGWESFFTGADKPDTKSLTYLKPKNGIFAYYPVKDRKASATVLAEYLDIDEKGQEVPKPYIVVNQPVRGRTAWIGSGEIYRIRQADLAFYDRFWVKLGRWVAANRDSRAARGKMSMSKDFTAGNPVRINCRILNTDGKVYPPDQDINTKARIIQTTPNGEFIKEFPPVPLVAKKSGTWDGYYQAQVAPGILPAGENYRYKAVVSDFPDAGGEKMDAEFIIRQSNPELDNTRPDYLALLNAASPVNDILGSIADRKATFKQADGSTQERPIIDLLRAGQPLGKERLAYKLAEREKIALIPECIETKQIKSRNRGAIEDLWDREVTPMREITDFLKSGPVSFIEWWMPIVALSIALGVLIMFFAPRPLLALVIIVGVGAVYCRYPFPVGIVVAVVVTLLSIEWMVRKLLRLA